MKGKLRKWTLLASSTLSTGSDIFSRLSTETTTSMRLSSWPLLCALGFILCTASTGGAAEQPVLPYLSSEYRYAIVSFGALPGFEQLSFDDSGFSIGDAAFGTKRGDCPLDSTVQTTWPLFTDLLLRKAFTLPTDASAVEVAVAIDNDIQVFVNGMDISGGLQVREGCAERDSFVFRVPDAILNFGGSNLLAVRARDRGGDSYVDVEVRAEIPESNRPPVCSVAAANPALLWPPNHELIPVAIVGVTDPDGDPITLTVTSVTQDESVNGLGDGDTSPDAVIQGSTVRLRAERAGPLNGRVYRITFTADDGRHGQCSLTVSVCVPHDQRGASCIDGGQLYDSTQP